VHGSVSVPVGLLLAWRAEIVTSQTEYLLAEAGQTAATAAKTAADAAARAAAANMRVAAARCQEASKRCKHAWSTYTSLVGEVCADTMDPPGGSGSSSHAGVVGKGKVRASSRSLAEAGEVIDVDVSGSDSENGEQDIMEE
jgi:membrane protein involved in colicin uptake